MEEVIVNAVVYPLLHSRTITAHRLTWYPHHPSSGTHLHFLSQPIFNVSMEGTIMYNPLFP